jgi:hypothetical protein
VTREERAAVSQAARKFITTIAAKRDDLWLREAAILVESVAESFRQDCDKRKAFTRGGKR